VDRLRDYDGPPPTPPKKGGMPTPWLIIREQIAEAWRMASWEIPARDDLSDPLADEVGRWIEVEVLRQKYPLA